MGSAALSGLLSGLTEIDALQRANPTPLAGGGLTRPSVVRALGRAEVVLLSGHLERYVRALNEEAATVIVGRKVPAGQLSDDLRLLHSRTPVDHLALAQWDRRGDSLKRFATDEAPIWLDTEAVANLDVDRLLAHMKAPNCKAIVRAFRIWGIPDIFAAITRSPVSKSRLRLRLDELVDKRNNIAHGDLTVEARYLDVVQYRWAVRKFCASADHRMAAALARISSAARPW